MRCPECLVRRWSFPGLQGVWRARRPAPVAPGDRAVVNRTPEGFRPCPARGSGLPSLARLRPAGPWSERAFRPCNLFFSGQGCRPLPSRQSPFGWKAKGRVLPRIFVRGAGRTTPSPFSLDRIQPAHWRGA